MNKNDLKKLVVCGFALGCLSVQSASADEKSQENVLVTTERTNVFAAGCGAGKCGGARSAPKNNRAMTPEEEQQIQNQGQGQGHSCAGKVQGQDQGQGHSCAGRSQPRPYQV